MPNLCVLSCEPLLVLGCIHLCISGLAPASIHPPVPPFILSCSYHFSFLISHFSGHGGGTSHRQRHRLSAVTFLFCIQPLSSSLIQTFLLSQVMEEAQVIAKGTGFRLSPVRNWKLALCIYLFWTLQMILIARFLSHPLHQLGFGGCCVPCL